MVFEYLPNGDLFTALQSDERAAELQWHRK